MANLSSSSGDGNLQVGVDAFGSFGSSVGGNGTSNAIYDPIGTFNGFGSSFGTTFQSGVAIRLGDSGRRSFLTTGFISDGGLANPGFNSQTTNSAESEFSFNVLDFDLTQTAQDSFAEGERIGSILTQVYEVTNTSDAEVSFELVRYLDGDLDGIINGGGRVVRDGEEILFETIDVVDSAESNTFVGITGEGGDTSGSGRFEIDSFDSIRSTIASGGELDDTINNDNDGDGLIDFDFDVTLGLNNEFVLAPGESTTYTTKTIFGFGSVEEIITEDPRVITQSLNVVKESGDEEAIDETENSISGGESNDALNGTANDDLLEGFGGLDVLDGGAGSDTLDGGEGVDTAVYQFSSTGVTANLADGTAVDGDGDTDTLISIENIIASELDDNLVGDDGANSLTGRGGNDVIDAAAGDDFVTGGNGSDLLIGGSGSDRFVYISPTEGGDTIEDFEVGTDKISLVSAVFGLSSGVLSENRFTLDTAATDGEQRFIYDNATGNLFFDRDGNGSQGQQLIANVGAGSGFSASDIELL